LGARASTPGNAAAASAAPHGAGNAASVTAQLLQQVRAQQASGGGARGSCSGAMCADRVTAAAAAARGRSSGGGSSSAAGSAPLTAQILEYAAGLYNPRQVGEVNLQDTLSFYMSVRCVWRHTICLTLSVLCASVCTQLSVWCVCLFMSAIAPVHQTLRPAACQAIFHAASFIAPNMLLTLCWCSLLPCCVRLHRQGGSNLTAAAPAAATRVTAAATWHQLHVTSSRRMQQLLLACALPSRPAAGMTLMMIAAESIVVCGQLYGCV
jgi:hypothetical protein